MRQKIKQHLPTIERKYQKFNTGNNFKVLRICQVTISNFRKSMARLQYSYIYHQDIKCQGAVISLIFICIFKMHLQFILSMLFLA